MNDSNSPIKTDENPNPAPQSVSQTPGQAQNPQIPAEKSVPAHKSIWYAIYYALQSILSIAIISATLFTLFTPRSIFSGKMFDSVILALQSTPEVDNLPTLAPESIKPKIGIVAGHEGHDAGTVCSDGLTEASVNMKIATLVRQSLLHDGYDVDLLQEFDPRLKGYKALALISIHNDSCDFINEQASGYKVAAAQGTKFPEKTGRLAACLTDRYAAITEMSFHSNTVTNDMSQYHAFDEIDPSTPAVIIETGFMNLDRQILTGNTGTVAEGVYSGIICYTQNELIPTREAPVQ